jgi:uncharacterized membrane protein YfcA
MNMNWRVAGLLWGVALLALSGCAAGAGGDGGGHPVPPKITSQPANQTVTAGQTSTFSITASGTAPLPYQWINVATANTPAAKCRWAQRLVVTVFGLLNP